MLSKGQFEEAQAECQTVTEGHIATLLADPESWKEYVAGWELTRKYAVSQAAIDISDPSSKVRHSQCAIVLCSVLCSANVIRYTLHSALLGRSARVWLSLVGADCTMAAFWSCMNLRHA
jgi:hypothetical protein